MELDGKVALLTGAAGGIGRATAVALGRAGAAAVVVLDVDRGGGVETTELVADTGATTEFLECDVADPASLERCFQRAERRFGGIDIVHNNAGLVGGLPAWPDTPLGRAQRIVEVNLGGVVYGTQLGVAALRRRGGGSIVSTASIGGLAPYPDDAVYGATKAAVVMLTRSSRRLRRERIHVNAVCPGIVDTSLLSMTGDGQAAPWLEGHLETVELLTPAQVAEVILQTIIDETLAGDVVTVDNPAVRGAPPIVGSAIFDD